MAVPRFWREIPTRYNLLGVKCDQCGKVYFPPRQLCQECGRKGNLRPYKVKGRGKIVSFTEIYVPAAGFERYAPYIIAMVQLEEGCNVLVQLTEVKPGEVKIGDEVEMVFRKINEEGEIINYGYKARPVKSF